MAHSQGIGEVHFGPFSFGQQLLVTGGGESFFSGPSCNQHLLFRSFIQPASRGKFSLYSELPVTFHQIFQFTFEVFKENRAA